MKTETKSIMQDKCESLFNKAIALKPSEYLYTSFGADNSFTIESRNDAFVLKVWDIYHLFEYHQRKEFLIQSAKDIKNWLIDYPEYYAKNHFDGALRHMDNWANLIIAFKIRQYEENNKYTH